jgi:hypothetical protein
LFGPETAAVQSFNHVFFELHAALFVHTSVRYLATTLLETWRLGMVHCSCRRW